MSPNVRWMRSRIAFFALVLFCFFLVGVGPSRADFDLPILYPVPKVVSIPEGMPHSSIERFAKVQDLTLEVRMTGGNMMRDNLVELLNRRFSKVTKRIALTGEVTQVHVDQLRRLQDFEVVYRVGPKGISTKTFNALYALGPVRKIIRMPGDVPGDQLKRIGRLKYYCPAIDLGRLGPSPELGGWILDKKHRWTGFVIPASLEPDGLFLLLEYRPIVLEIQTVKNRISKELLNVLKDLRGVETTVVVDGRLTLADVRRFARLERFSLRVQIDQPAGITPGLIGVLNRVAPPRGRPPEIR